MESFFTLLKMPLAWIMPFFKPILSALPGSEYFSKCIGESYGDFDGRARRSEFWYFMLSFLVYYIIVTIVLIIIGFIFDIIKLAALGYLITGVVALIAFIPFVVPSIAVAVRRLHDTGKSGWFYLLNFVPFVGGIILLIFYISDSTPGDNEYGKNPKGV